MSILGVVRVRLEPLTSMCTLISSVSSTTDTVFFSSVPIITTIVTVAAVVTSSISHLTAMSLVDFVSASLVTSLYQLTFYHMLNFTQVRVTPKTAAVLMVLSVGPIVISCL